MVRSLVLVLLSRRSYITESSYCCAIEFNPLSALSPAWDTNIGVFRSLVLVLLSRRSVKLINWPSLKLNIV